MLMDWDNFFDLICMALPYRRGSVVNRLLFQVPLRYTGHIPVRKR